MHQLASQHNLYPASHGRQCILGLQKPGREHGSGQAEGLLMRLPEPLSCHVVYSRISEAPHRLRR